MIKSLTMMVLLFFFGCASSTRPLTRKSMREMKLVSITARPMASAKEARHQIQNHINFLTLLYEQSIDPYYNTPKWTPDCLAATKIGKLEQFNHNLQSVSELYLDKAGSVGHCPQNRYAIKSKLIYLYCENEKQLYEIKVPVTETLKLSKESLCD